MIDLQAFADELEQSLQRDLIDHWYPRCVDPAGGYHQLYDRRWRPGNDASRFIVNQSRHLWVTSTIAHAYPDRREEFLGYAGHGVRFLTERLFDGQGFQWWLGEHERRFGEKPGRRITYGTAFAIYALAAAARNGDAKALEYARRGFDWLEAHCHDDAYGGYFELTEEDGTPVLEPLDPGVLKRDGLANPYGLKTQNTHLHLMEALAELYRVWHEVRVKGRIRELMGLLTGPFLYPGGESAQCLYRDLTPSTDLVSYGHDIENAHLLIDAALTIGEEPPLQVARRFADYVWENGWDRVNGGIFYFGRAGGSPTNRSKSWWSMPEAVLGYVTVFKQTGEERYLRAANDVWRWTVEHLIDREYGGWFSDLSEAGAPIDDRKGHAWKACYHETRALLHGSRLLRGV